MRKHIRVRSTSSAGTLTAGAALAAAVTIVLGGCTASGTPSAQGGSSTTTKPSGGATSATAGMTPTSAATSPSGAPAGTPGSGASSGGTVESGTSSTCAGAQLSLSTSQDSAAGFVDYIVLEFVNQSSTTCTVEGYPGAAGYGVTSSNYAINSTRQLSGKVGDQYTAPAPVSLKPGSTASTILEWLDQPTPGHPHAYCLRFGSGSFGITAPNTTRTTHIPLPSDVCSGLLVHPLVPGATGRQSG